MDGCKPSTGSGGVGGINLGSEVKCEPGPVKNEYEMDHYVIKEESFEESDEMSNTVEI